MLKRSDLDVLFNRGKLWPLWVPLSILLIEENPMHKKILKLLVVLGSSISGFLAYRLFFYSSSAAITPYHIHYGFDFPFYKLSVFISIVYFLITIVPPFVSNSKRISSSGFPNLASFLVIIVLFEDYVISVWFFFAAIISWEVFNILKQMSSALSISVTSPSLIKSIRQI